jgi:hypothetical protein
VTASTTAARRTRRDPKAGVATIVSAQPQLTVPHLVLAWAGTAGALNILDETGTPLGGTLRDPGAQVGDQVGLGRNMARGGNVLDELGGRRVRAAIKQHRARAVIVPWPTVEAALAAYHRGELNPRLEYEQAAVQTPGGLLALPGYDEWLKTWKGGQAAADEATHLEKIRVDLEDDLAQPLDVAVVLVYTAGGYQYEDDGTIKPSLTSGGRDNTYFRTGIDPNASSLLSARADTSPVGIRGGPVPGGRIDDPAKQLADPDRWGVPEAVQDDPQATHAAPVWRTRNTIGPQDPATYATPDAPPPPEAFAPPKWELGEVVPLTPQAAHTLRVQTADLGTTPQFAQLYQSGATLVFSWGTNHERWSAGGSATTLGEFNPTEWAVQMARNAMDKHGPRPAVLLAAIKDLDVDLHAVAQVIPVATVEA